MIPQSSIFTSQVYRRLSKMVSDDIVRILLALWSPVIAGIREFPNVTYWTFISQPFVVLNPK